MYLHMSINELSTITKQYIVTVHRMSIILLIHRFPHLHQKKKWTTFLSTAIHHCEILEQSMILINDMYSWTIYRWSSLSSQLYPSIITSNNIALGSVLPSGSWGGKGVGGPMHKYTHTILLQVSYQ